MENVSAFYNRYRIDHIVKGLRKLTPERHIDKCLELFDSPYPPLTTKEIKRVEKYIENPRISLKTRILLNAYEIIKHPERHIRH